MFFQLNKRLMTDAQYYTRKLSTLEGLQGPSNDLEIAVNNIQITDNSSKEDLSNTANTTTTNASPPSFLRINSVPVTIFPHWSEPPI